jgi:hypothetical protein
MGEGAGMKIKRLLIANRGEIALRIIRTCREMGIKSLAVYSDADARARHVREADESFRLGPAEAAASYLNQTALIEAAKAMQADAVHPGYGFLSERAEFAETVASAGLVYVGPPPSATRALGSKIEAKLIAQKAGVPLVPGFFSPNATDEELESDSDDGFDAASPINRSRERWQCEWPGCTFGHGSDVRRQASKPAHVAKHKRDSVRAEQLQYLALIGQRAGGAWRAPQASGFWWRLCLSPSTCC